LRFWIFILLAIGFVSVTGCDKSPAQNGSPTAPPRPKTVFGTASVRGSVKFIGTPPPRAEIPNEPCHDGSTPLKDETVIVNPNSTLANVFVYLENATESDGSDRPPALLDQINCRYAPHVIGVQVNQPLRIRSSDPHTLHNVHLIATRNPAMNFGLTEAGAEKTVTFQNAEFIRAKCDVHPWMTAYIGVFDSPFFSISSDKDGSFEIDKIPPGKYKLVAWHEQYGKMERPIEVKDGQKLDVTLTFKAP
jgi:hypothetical protein